ncbi:MAG: hypothetical protein GY822_32490 [Deltaproteobacteria bacterium]|nr:hypothetical protein [Deltaproteobacteria bacterium]
MNDEHAEKEVEIRLAKILSEIEAQPEIGRDYSKEQLAFTDEVQQIKEYIFDVQEYSIAYECIVCILESSSCLLTGKSAILLLEVGLSLQYKTDRISDSKFDFR